MRFTWRPQRLGRSRSRHTGTELGGVRSCESKAEVNGIPEGISVDTGAAPGPRMETHLEYGRSDDVEASEARVHKGQVSGINVDELPRGLRCGTSS
jgi:hypothetical protein